MTSTTSTTSVTGNRLGDHLLPFLPLLVGVLLAAIVIGGAFLLANVVNRGQSCVWANGHKTCGKGLNIVIGSNGSVHVTRAGQSGYYNLLTGKMVPAARP